MNDRCPHCGGPLRQASTPVERLRELCENHGHFVAADGSVFEEVAAWLLGRARHTLQNWRANSGGVVPFHRTAGTGRIRYHLGDLAEFMASHGIPPPSRKVAGPRSSPDSGGN